MRTITQPLSEGERTDLVACEAVIAHGKQTFVEVAVALMAICDRRLYRETFGSFNEYCAQKWDFSARYGQNLIAACRVVKQLEADPDPEVRSSASHLSARAATELAKVPAPQRAAVVKTASTNGKVTAQAIRETAEVRNNVSQSAEEKMPAIPLWSSEGLTPEQAAAKLESVVKATRPHLRPLEELSDAARALIEELEVERVENDGIIDCIRRGDCDASTLAHAAEHRMAVARLLTKFKKEICGCAQA